jgi:hypothetical protein
VEEILADEAVHPSMRLLETPDRGNGDEESPQSPDRQEAVVDLQQVVVPLSLLTKSPGGSMDGTVVAISVRADEDEAWIFPSPVPPGPEDHGV